jgi:hypothetical protein
MIIRRGWTPREDAVLQRGALVEQTVGDVARQIGRTMSAVLKRARVLQIKLRRSKSKSLGPAQTAGKTRSPTAHHSAPKIAPTNRDGPEFRALACGAQDRANHCRHRLPALPQDIWRAECTANETRIKMRCLRRAAAAQFSAMLLSAVRPSGVALSSACSRQNCSRSRNSRIVNSTLILRQRDRYG